MFKISVPSKYVPGNKDFMVFTDAGNPGTDSTPPRIAFLCHSKNKPPALQVEGRFLDIRNSCARINVGLQTTNIKTQEVQDGQ